MKLNQADFLSLEKVYQLGLELEKTAQDFAFEKTSLADFCIALRQFQSSSNPDLLRIAEIERHLKPDMSLRHFSNFLIQIERLLEKPIKDSDFLITTEDTKTELNVKRYPIVLILENIRSAFNLGSIFRSADGLGVSELALVGYTPTPENQQVRKTSLGAENSVNWRYFNNSIEGINFYKEKGFLVVGLETSDKAVTLETLGIDKPTAFFLGNERFGLDSKTLAHCDAIVKLPMNGVKNSYNVATTAALISYAWIRRWTSK